MNPKHRMFARGRKRPGVMNKLESDYAKRLEIRKAAGEIEWWAYEGIKLRLADKTFFTPDFFVLTAEGFLECHETKGFMMDDANVKIKAAAEKFPFKFFVIKKARGEWDIREV